MSKLTDAAKKDETGLLAAFIALFKRYLIMKINGGHSPADWQALAADVHDLDAKANPPKKAKAEKPADAAE